MVRDAEHQSHRSGRQHTLARGKSITGTHAFVREPQPLDERPQCRWKRWGVTNDHRANTKRSIVMKENVGAVDSIPVHILIIGGSQFLGRYLTEASLAHEHAVTLFNRGKSNPDLFPHVEKLHGDRNENLDALAGRRWDVVIDTCGYTSHAVRATAELLERCRPALHIHLELVGLCGLRYAATERKRAHTGVTCRPRRG